MGGIFTMSTQMTEIKVRKEGDIVVIDNVEFVKY